MVVSALAFALYVQVEWRWFVLGWIGLVPWLLAVDRAHTAWGAVGLGVAMSVAFVLAVFAWFATAVAAYTGWPWPVALALLVVLAPLLQPQLVTCALARHVATRRGAGVVRAAVVGAGVYVGTEWAVPKLFGDTIGHGFLASAWMRQAADLAGAPGLTFVLLLANGLVAGTRRDRWMPLVGVGTMAAVLLLYGAVRLRTLDAGEAPVTAALIQADLVDYERLAAERGRFEAVREILAVHRELSLRAQRDASLDVVVWPETVYPTTFGAPKSDAGAELDREVAGIAGELGVPLIFGAYDAEGDAEFNAAMFLPPPVEGRIAFDAYRKAVLFPLTERVPALVDSPALRNVLPWLGTWRPGPGARVVPLALRDGRTLRVAPLICYDAVVPSLALDAVRGGAEVLVTLSNDAWFMHGNGPRLHLVVSAFRSIETRRPQLRATNTGISAVIDATGELRAVTGVHERVALLGTVAPERTTWTLMLAWGDWFGPMALAIGLAALAMPWRRPYRARPMDARRSAVLLLIATCLLAGACRSKPRELFVVPAADQATRRALPAGEVVGGVGRYGAHAWLGIPYAQPPVGPLRWRSPQPMPPWTGTREALASGAACMQAASEFGGTDSAPGGTPTGSEDCLTLNVWAPQFLPDAVPAAGKRLPVMVWIHGGGNTVGTASFYDGGNLATTYGMVVVAIQYRLGPFGWLRHDALRAGAADDVERSGNFGTLDQVRALAWVRENVAAFGGDPDNVTVFGESAGGQNVYMMLLAPQARGLFQRAIVESGGLWAMTLAEAEDFADDPQPGHRQSSNEILLRLLQTDGAPDRAAARAKLAAMEPSAVAGWLRAKPANDILLAYDRPPSGLIDMPRVFRDGVVVPDGDLAERLRQPNGWNRVPVMAGTNRDEQKLFLFPDPTRIHYLLGFLPRFVDEPWYQASAEYLSRLWKVVGADGPAQAMTQNQPGVFLYRFDWDEEPSVLGADLGQMLGAAHAFEIPFVFGHWDLGRAGNRIFTSANEPGRQALSRAMMSYWAQFARTGNPGKGAGGDLPEWPAWHPTAPSYIVFDTPAGGGIHLVQATETKDRVLADIQADPRLAAPRARCRILRELAAWGRAYGKAEYAEACPTFPFDGYPWPD